LDLTLLQGNEPLFPGQKKDIQTFLSAENPKKALPDDATLGHAPGRRIEEAKASTSGIRFEDSNPKTDKSPAPIWIWGGDTLLVAAGPPKSAPRPAAVPAKGGKGKAVRKLTDWTGGLRSAPESDLIARFESMLFEARALIEAEGGTLIEAEAQAVGAAAGARIWELGKKAADLGNLSHFRPMQDILDILSAFQTSRQADHHKAGTPYDDISVRLFKQIGWIRQAFETAARGIADIAFPKSAGDKDAPVNVLVTGFDPFEPSGSLRRPAAGEWNPSGAAALALDGQRLPISSTKGAKGTVAVESLVLPVSYDAIKGGIVEQAIGPHASEVDAVLTVSEDAGLDPAKPVRLERYAVGVHEIKGKVEGVPGAAGGSAGPAIIESPAPLEKIASGTKAPASKGAPAVQEPTIGNDITFQFRTTAEADAALVGLGLPAAHSPQVKIGDEKALLQITSSMKRSGDSADIRFQAGTKWFDATVVQGPGGNFLSNEVSFRALRQLASSGSAKHPISFHTHTQRSDEVPAGDKLALANAMGLRARLIATLKRIIGAVGRAVLDKRPPTAKP
jgi:hypothetical protein